MSAFEARLLPFLLAGLSMLGPFSINIYMPSFAEMKSVFGVGDVEMQLTLSLYFAAFAFMSLWHGAIADSCGRRPVVVVGLLVYALAALGCATATNIEQIYLCRVLQGASAGAGIVVGRAVIRDLYKGVEAQRLYALVIMLFALAQPAIILQGLDCVPDRRGMGASLQLFTQTGFNSLLSAFIAPFFWGTPFMLAVGAALLLALAMAGVIVSWLGRY